MRRTKEDAEITRCQLLEAALVVFKRSGIRSAKLDDIAKEANVTRGAISWHFKNKTNLFRTLIEEGSHEAVTSAVNILEQESEPRIRIESFLKYIVNDRKLKHNQVSVINKLVEENAEEFADLIDMIKKASDGIIKALTHTIKEGKNTGAFKQSLNPSFTAKALYTFTWGFFTDNELLFNEYSDDDLYQHLTDFFDQVLLSC